MSSLDNITDALKDGKQLSKTEYSKLKKLYEAAGKNLDDIIEIPFKYADEVCSGITKIAKKYENLECVECADDIVTFLKKHGMDYEIMSINILKIDGVDPRHCNIWSDLLGKAISNNGIHKGVLFNGKIYDNLNPNGIKLEVWLSDLNIPYGKGSVDLWQLYKAGKLILN